MIVVLKKERFGELIVGLVKSIAFHKQAVFFCCKSFEAKLSKYGYYVTTNITKNQEIVQVNDLADHHPLHRIGTPENFIFLLHHYVSAGSYPPEDDDQAAL